MDLTYQTLLLALGTWIVFAIALAAAIGQVAFLTCINA